MENKNLFSKLLEFVEASLDSRIAEYKKSDLEKGERVDGTVGRKGLIFDPQFESHSVTGLFKPKSSYLSNAILKQVSRRDAFVAAVIDLRASQVASFCKKPSNRFDYGFKISAKDASGEVDQDEIRRIEEFILNCGYTESRATEDKLTLDQWGYIVTRDMLVYGHFAVEKVLRRDGDLYSFLPLPAETIYYANKKADPKVIDQMRDSYKQVLDKDKLDLDKAARGEYEYVQVIHGKVVEGFTSDELLFSRHNLESDIDLNGYCYSPLERAMSAIISHMQVENHQRQFFTHGVASKGLLVLQGDVTPSTLKMLQTQWNNQLTGPMNAWRTPILAGIKGVQWVPLTASNRDMEYAAWQDYVLRIICSAMAVSPEEVGFDYLSRGTEQRSMSESSNEWKLTASRDRGLRPILGRIEAVINEEILPLYSKEISKKYHFSFVGLESETEQEEIARLQQETALVATMDEARKQTERDPLPYGGNLILNPTLLSVLQNNMPKGMFMETFLGIEGASQRPDLQYVPDPMWFQWQQLQQQMMMQQQAAAQAPESEGESTDETASEQAEGGQSQEQQDAAQQQAMAQQQAIEQYMAANPELFKAMRLNLEIADALSKSQKMSQIVNTKRIERTREHLVKDFRQASNQLVKEILQIVAEDMKDK